MEVVERSLVNATGRPPIRARPTISPSAVAVRDQRVRSGRRLVGGVGDPVVAALEPLDRATTGRGRRSPASRAWASRRRGFAEVDRERVGDVLAGRGGAPGVVAAAPDWTTVSHPGRPPRGRRSRARGCPSPSGSAREEGETCDRRRRADCPAIDSRPDTSRALEFWVSKAPLAQGRCPAGRAGRPRPAAGAARDLAAARRLGQRWCVRQQRPEDRVEHTAGPGRARRAAGGGHGRLGARGPGVGECQAAARHAPRRHLVGNLRPVTVVGASGSSDERKSRHTRLPAARPKRARSASSTTAELSSEPPPLPRRSRRPARRWRSVGRLPVVRSERPVDRRVLARHLHRVERASLMYALMPPT